MKDDGQILRAKLIRNFEQVALQHEQREPLYDTACARLAKGTAASKLGISIDVLAPGKAGCPYHFHYAQEEAFVVLEGRGTLRIAGEHIPIGAGDTIFVPPGPDYPHQIINTSDGPLKYLSISTRETPEIVVYPDSDKFLARASTDGRETHLFEHVNSLASGLDYWDGEP